MTTKIDEGSPYAQVTDAEYGLLADMLHLSVSKHKLDDCFTLVWANKYYYQFIGYPKEEYERLFDNRPDRYFADNPEDLAVIARHVMEALDTDAGGYECIAGLNIKDGTHKWVKFKGIFLDEYVDGYQLSYTTMMDVTDLVEAQEELGRQKGRLEEANEELERLAFVDPVTGGFNQARFDRAARSTLDQASPGEYALVALDLKKFKLLNEIQGTESGDLVLRYVYQCLDDHLGETECVGRISADAFNMLMRTEDEQAMYARIDNMVQDVNKFNVGANRPYFLSFTVGVYPIDEPALSMTTLRDRANVARNFGKESSNARHFSCVFYSDLDRQNLLFEQDMENRMHGALERGRVRGVLPAQTAPCRQRDSRRRGAGPLDGSRARPHSSRRLRAALRAQRVHHQRGSVRVRAGVRPAGVVGGAGARPRAHFGEHVARASAGAGFPDAFRGDPEPVRGARLAHRVRAD